MARVLVVDDDPALLRALRLALQLKGHEVKTARTGQEGLAEASFGAPDVVVLDVGLPDMDGLEVCKRLRQWSQVPVIVLSAIGAEDRKVAALDGGADDYMTKPFGMAELEARIRAALRHGAPGPGPDGATQLPTAIVGDLELDFTHHQVTAGLRQVELTAKEFDLLSFLARHQGKVCTHQMLLQAVWGTGYGREAQYLHAYVHRLRQKLTGSGAAIKTNAGVGYSLVETRPEPSTEDG